MPFFSNCRTSLRSYHHSFSFGSSSHLGFSFSVPSRQGFHSFRRIRTSFSSPFSSAPEFLRAVVRRLCGHSAPRSGSPGSLARSGALVTPGYEKRVGYWLLGNAGLVLALVVWGGYTRLSLAGLSMTSWSFVGSQLPSSADHWQREFAQYQKTPEFSQLHADMTLNEFKQIYIIEWMHRMLGRVTGLFYLGGLALLGRRMRPKMLATSTGLLCAGGVQGLVGWWMVQSGLQENEPHLPPRVSPYRLVFHLATALSIYSVLVWNSFSLLIPRTIISLPTQFPAMRGCGAALTALCALTVLSGGFVAGIDAGHAYNTWPKMLDDRWVPEEVLRWQGWRQLFESTPVVQFDHRMLGYLTVLASSALFLYIRQLGNLPRSVKVAAHLLPAVSALQVVLGIGTLLIHVPPYMGCIHQTGGVLTLTSALYFLHTASRLVAK